MNDNNNAYHSLQSRCAELTYERDQLEAELKIALDTLQKVRHERGVWERSANVAFQALQAAMKEVYVPRS